VLINHRLNRCLIYSIEPLLSQLLLVSSSPDRSAEGEE